MNEKQVIGKLNRLHRFCIAGERGFEVVAENVSNRGLKVLLKSFAQQRADFADELRDEIHRLGGECSERRSIRGVIHCGRINIRSALTIGAQNVENVALGEVMHGENAIVKAYQSLQDKELPAETQAIVSRQLEQIESVRDQVNLLRGRSGKRLVVRLLDSEDDAETAIQALGHAGFNRSDIELVDLKQVRIYEGQGSTVSETVVSGAVGGGLWGVLIGSAVGVGALFVPGMGAMVADNYAATWITFGLVGIIIGALFGAILGSLIGRGVTEQDTYLYDDSLIYGTTLLQLLTDDDDAMEASRILHQVNAAARSRSTSKSAERAREAEPIQAEEVID